MAGDAHREIVDKLIDMAEEAVDTAGISLPNEQTAEEIADTYLGRAIPAHGKKSLADVLNAGWKVFKRCPFFPEYPDIQDAEECLKDVILKSIEIIEVENRTTHRA